MTALLSHLTSSPAGASRRSWLLPLTGVVWLVLLAAVLSWPSLTQSPTLGEDLTRNTVRLCLLFYAAAVVLLLRLQPADWDVSTRRGRLARWLWTLSWLAYFIHLGMAFHHYHGWSHAAAVEHVRKRSNFGEGIYVSHLFTLLWSADVVWWWLWPRGHAGRSPWLGGVLHGFMLFVIFNGTVVYEDGPIRWAGVVLFVVLGALFMHRLRERRTQPLPGRSECGPPDGGLPRAGFRPADRRDGSGAP
jgi:hypothetical protein